MKKIIIPFDGSHFSKGAFSFANSLHEMKPILLTGIFLRAVDYARFFFFPTAFAAHAYVPMLQDFEEEEVENNIEQFTKYYRRILYNIVCIKTCMNSPYHN